MNFFGWEITRKQLSIDQVIRNFEAIYQTVSAESITPDNCMRSPTVHAIVSGISKAVSSLGIHVYEQTTTNGRTVNKQQPNHPVMKLLEQPNEYQTSVDYWLDATSTLLRYGRYYAVKARPSTGPIRELHPLLSSSVQPKQQEDLSIKYEVISADGKQRTYTAKELHVARMGARDFIKGDSWINDCREAIALEIAAEKFGAAFFGGGAMPGIVFKFVEGFQAFRTDEEKRRFVEEFQAKYATSRGRFRAALLPKGIEFAQAVGIENDKAQFLETRKYQRTVICGSAGVPPYMVGDLERQTFNNAEQQFLNKVVDVIHPIVRIFEAAMERDLLTTENRNQGIIIRFNLDSALRGDYKTRQEGLNIQRQAGVINANDWREQEHMNPISAKDGGEEYWRQGPSGQNAKPNNSSPQTGQPTQNTPGETVPTGDKHVFAGSNGH